MKALLDNLRPKFQEAGAFANYRGIFELFDSFLYSNPARTATAPHVRDATSNQRILNNFVIATIPCWLLGIWNLGAQTHRAMAEIGMQAAPGWRGSVMAFFGAGYDQASVADSMLHGFLYFLPIFVAALLAGAFWEALFAVWRRRHVDAGLFSIAWLFALILPATASIWQVVLGMSFGIVIGKQIFGGTGRYLVNPSLLALAFLVFSYPALLFAEGAWLPVPGYDEPTAIELAVDEGGTAVLLSVGYSWTELFVGGQPGPIGVTSVLGCLLGAMFLIATGSASWRIMAGSVIGLVLTVLVFNAVGPEDDPMWRVPWYWHAVIGGWAFGTVFLATDPTAAAVSNAGRWGFGVLVGVLTIIVRVTNPAYYEGVIFAILLASIFSPLIDYAVVQRNIRWRQRRDGALT